MKQTLLSFLILTALTCFNMGFVVAQDGACANGGPIGTPASNVFCIGVSAPSDVAVSAIPTSEETMAQDYRFVIADNNNLDSLGNPIIAALSVDGSFDFDVLATTYTVTGFAYNQSEIDSVGAFLNDNPALAAIAGLPPEALPLPSPLPLQALFDIAQGLIGDLTVPSVLGALDIIRPLVATRTMLCYGTTDMTYEVVATDDASQCEPVPVQGDECSDPIVLEGFPTTEGDVLFYGPYDNTEFTVSDTDPLPACFFEGTLENTMWFSFVGDGNVYDIRTSAECAGGLNLNEFDLYITDGDTQMAAYTGDDCGNLTEVLCNEDSPDFTTGDFFAELSIETEAGVTYYIMVDGFNSSGSPAVGSFCFAVSLGQPCTAFVELAPDTPTTFELCSDETAFFNIDTNTLDFGPTSANGIVWNILSVDPMGENPNNLPSEVDLGLFLGHPFAGDFEVGGDGSGDTVWVVGIIGAVDLNAGQVSFDPCIDFTEAVQIINVPDGQGDCPDIVPCEVVVELAPGTPTEFNICDGDSAVFNIDTNTLSFAGSDANGIVWNVFATDPGNDPFSVPDSLDLGLFLGHPLAGDFVINWQGDAITIWAIAIPGAIDLNAGTVGFDNCIAFSPAIQINSLAADDPACAVVVDPLETTAPITSGGPDVFTVAFSISGGTAPYSVNGNAIEGSDFSDDVPCGTAYSYVVSDADGTTLDAITGTTDDCPVPLAVGDVSVTGGPDVFTVSFTISGGATPYSVNGNAIEGGDFSDDVPCGTAYSYVVSDADGTTLDAITGTTDDCPPPSCEVDAGSIATVDGATAVTICISDDTPDGFDISAVLGTVGNQSGYVITDAATGNILALAPADQINFDLSGAGVGVCNIYRYEADTVIEPLVGLEVGSNLGDVAGCFALSNPIAVTRNEVVVTLTADCDAQNGEALISVAVSGGTGPYTLSGDFAGQISANETLLIGNFSDGSLISITATDANGCSGTDSEEVTCTKCVNELGGVVGNDADGFIYVCDGGTATVSVNDAVVDTEADENYALFFSITDESGNTTFILDAGDDFTETFDINGFNTNEVLTVVAIITTNVDGQPGDADECTVTSDNALSVVFLEPVEVIVNVDCDEQQIPTLTVSATGGLPAALLGATYTLTGTPLGGNSTLELNESIPIVFTNGTAYAYTATDAVGCSGSIDGITDCIKTPVEWLPFNGEVLSVGNLLTWGTASEINNAYFQITRSLDGTNFEVIGTVNAQNNETGASYNFLDKTAPIGTAYYVLTQFDVNGVNSEHPNKVQLTRGEVGFVLGGITPVPAQNYIEIGFTSDQASTVIMNIHDITGRLVGTQNGSANPGANVLTVDVASYASGVYFISITNNTETLTGRFIKK